jgi:hypothetical protein
LLADRPRLTAGLVFLSVHLHLLEDLIGSRGPDGYQWPIPYFEPFSKAGDLTWRVQWALNGWPNLAITTGLLLLTLYLALARGFSPLEMISPGADAAFVDALGKTVLNLTEQFQELSGLVESGKHSLQILVTQILRNHLA